MDNLTHSLVGIVAAESVFALRKHPRSPGYRRWCWIVSIAANNLPDADFLLSRWTGGKLGYLLQHRGYTHTLAAIPVLGALCLFAAWGWRAARRQRFSKDEWVGLTSLALFGVGLHIAFDFLNSYGVHPFWPWNNTWFYGDTLFIIEPLLWAVMLPWLLRHPSPIVRRVASIGGLGFIALLLFAPAAWLSRYAAIAVLVWTFFLWRVGSRLGEQGRLLLTSGGVLGVIALFAIGSHLARRQIEHQTQGLRDVALSPLPANPLCWRYLTVEQTGDKYVSRRGTLAHLSPSLCPADLSEGTPEYEMPLSRLRALNSSHCEIAAALRFLRIPLIDMQGDNYLVADLRFERKGSRNFGRFLFARKTLNCPSHVPPWIPPREDLLETK